MFLATGVLLSCFVYFFHNEKLKIVYFFLTQPVF